MDSPKPEREQFEHEEHQAFLQEAGSSEPGSESAQSTLHRCRCNPTRYMRLGLDVAMAVTIVVLLLSTWKRQPLRTTPVPSFPRKIYTFRDSQEYVSEHMFFNETETMRTLHKWIALSSGSRGYVVIKDAGRYELPDPLTVRVNPFEDGPGYMMSVFHQLHCLSYVVEQFQKGYGGVNLTEEVAHHSAHCFNYLRQGIMCSADTTLEGRSDLGPGEGSEHECKDYDAFLQWANDNAAYKWHDLPLETGL